MEDVGPLCETPTFPLDIVTEVNTREVSGKSAWHHGLTPEDHTADQHIQQDRLTGLGPTLPIIIPIHSTTFFALTASVYSNSLAPCVMPICVYSERGKYERNHLRTKASSLDWNFCLSSFFVSRQVHFPSK